MQFNQSSKVTLTILLGSLFIAFLGIGLVIPVLPTLMNELGLTGQTVGSLVAAFAIVQFICSPIAGKWVDQYGRKPILIIGLLVFAISELLFGIGKNVEVLFASRMLGGVSAAFIMPAVTAFIADVTSLETRSKALGYMSAAISTGFIIGPGIGGFLAGIGTRVPFYAAAVLGGFAALVAFALLREPAGRQHKQRNPAMEPISRMARLRKMVVNAYWIVFMLIFVSTLGLAAFESLFSLLVDHKFGFTPQDIAIVITGGAIVGAIAQVLLFDRLTRKIGEIKLVRYCMALSALFAFLMTIVHTYALIMLTTFMLFVGFDLIRPAVTTYLSKNAGDEQGFVGGMNSAYTSLGTIFGPLIGGALFDYNLNYPFYFATVVLLLGLGLAMFWRRPANDQTGYG